MTPRAIPGTFASRCRRVVTWKPIVVVVALVGCGEGRLSLYPVSGKVLVDGKPAERALVTFHSVEGDKYKARSFAITNRDGAFRAFTFDRDDGMPAGDYVVTIELPQLGHNDDDDPGPDLLGGRYAEPAASRLRVNISNGDNELPAFSLTTTP